jgi:multiple sugar transport system substrate-binding protein
VINRRQMLKALAVGGSVTVAGGSILGCSARPVSDQRDPNTIRLWGIFEAGIPAQTKIIEAFTKENPDVKVEVSKVQNSGAGDTAGVITAVRGRTAPDLYFMDRFNATQFSSLGLIEPINSLIEKYEDESPEEFLSQWLKFSTDEMFYDGNWYGLPLDTDTRVMMYNKDLAEEVGIDPKLLDPDNGPLSYDQMWEINDEVNVQDKRGSYKRVTWIPWDNQGSFLLWAMGMGVELFDNDSCHTLLDSDQMLHAVEVYQSWVKRLNFPRMDAFKATYEPPNHPPSQTSFFSGRQLFQITTPVAVTDLNNYKPDLNYGLTHIPVPKKGDKPYTWAGGWSLAMPKGSSMSENLWKFLKFYAGYQGQKELMPTISGIPTNIKAVEDPKAWNPDIEFFVELMGVAQSRPPLPAGTKLWDAVFALQDSINQGSATPKEAVERAQNYTDPTMQQFCPFKLPEGFGQPDPNFSLPVPGLDT